MDMRWGYYPSEHLTDSTPNSFSFSSQSVGPSILTYSNIVTIAGIDTQSEVSVSGNDGAVSINGGSYVTSGYVNNGDTIRARVTSPSTYGAPSKTTTVTVGGVSAVFSVSILASGQHLLNYVTRAAGDLVVAGTLTSPNTLTYVNTNCYAVGKYATEIPKDGEWYYSEVISSHGNYTYHYPTAMFQTQAQIDTGIIAWVNIGNNFRRFAIRWDAAAGRWTYKRYTGTIVTATTLLAATNLLKAYMAVANINVSGGTVQLLLHASQWQGPMPTDITAKAIAPG